VTNPPRPEPDPKGEVDRQAASLYESLRTLALQHLGARGPRPLDATELVHECYLRLARMDDFRDMGRPEFFALASRLFRSVLVDQVRRDRAEKRGDGWRRVTLSEVQKLAEGPDVDVLALDEALGRLERLDERQGRIVELRFFGGLSGDEVANLLGVSRRTVTKEWGMARAWLKRELGAG
jgi:RNA polymerase sigma-70 factor (ECF subfamily)